ncbi:MAG: class I SAM-dependent methyltransferase [Desulfuromonadaceae bacterium]|nr:class I SAM-dependent methyltransferase [Desulfuromonadaceae bacterium]
MADSISKSDLDQIRQRYEQRFRNFGYSPKTLDWDKGKQDIRFSILTSQLDFTGKSVLDIGCGFGDLNLTLNSITNGNYRYLGVDICPPLIEEARKRYGSEKVEFFCGDIRSANLNNIDYAIASGIFNQKFEHSDNKGFIEDTMRWVFDSVNIGFAFNFLSDKVDYRKDNTYHSSPEEILGMAYKLSRNLLLLNNCMPFEFSLFVFKDDSFDPATTIFNRWKDLSGPVE